MMGRWARRFATLNERPIYSYAAAVGAVAVAAALRVGLSAVVSPAPDFAFFYPALMFAAVISGFRGGLVALAASAIFLWLLWSLDESQPVAWSVHGAHLLVFGVTSLATIAIAKSLRIAVRRGAAAEERFQIFQDQTLDAFVFVEPIVRDGRAVDFRWTYANAAADRIAPDGARGLVGRSVLELFPDETGAETVERMKRVLTDRTPDDVEVRRLIGGEERWLRSSAVPLGDGVAISFRDVTDRIVSETKAIEGRNLFRNIANAAPVLIWMSNAEQKATWFNDSWLAFTGRSLEQELGRGWLDLVHPDDRAMVLERYNLHWARREPGRVEYRVRRHDGQYRWLDEAAAPSFDGEGRFMGYVGSCVDVTDRKIAEQALRSGEARIRALVDSLPQLLWSNRTDGFCDYLSPQWVAYTGRPAEAHKGDGWLEAVHPEDRDSIVEAWAQAVAGGLPFDVEYRIRRHDGVWRWFAGRASAVREEDGTIRRWFGSSSDITEIVEARRHLEDRVAERTRELEASLEERARTEAALAQAQRLETVGRLTGGVAHDFNNLLTVVIGGLDMILKRPDDESRVRRLAESALAAGRRGERLTRQLLAFARRQELKLEVVDIGPLIVQLEPLFRRAVHEGVDLSIRCAPNLGSSRVDPVQFESALMNLVVNAADVVGTSGRIAIEAARHVLADGEIPDAAAGDYVRISVSDTGPGMNEEVMAKAFEPFFTTKEVGKGTGLGLAQVYGFTRQAGGGVSIKSAPGRGATINLFLPCAQAAADVRPAAPADTEYGPDRTRGARILLVEDDAAVRTVTEGLLSELGCRVAAEPDGLSALRRLRTGEDFDLLLSDIVMPGGMSGVDLARQAQATWPRLPILLTTGYAGDRFDDGAESIAWPVLRKPFRAEQLENALREALAEAGAA